MARVRTMLEAGQKIRVLVCDDSVVIRRMVSRALEQDPGLEVVAVARDGVEVMARIAQFRPHVVTLDVEMPEMDGLGALREIVRRHPEVRVLMLSAHTAKGAQVTVQALLLGASDYVTKPCGGEAVSVPPDKLAGELAAKIRQLFLASPSPVVRNPVSSAPWMPKGEALTTERAEVVAIGTSTGGPAALAELLPGMPAGFPLPVLVVQHMPPDFTGLLAAQLARLSPLQVVEGADGMEACAGRVIIAPGDQHMRLVRSGTRLLVRLDREPQENFCRPAVDVLFRSVAETCGGRAVAAVLTGMGQDGLAGARLLHAQGAPVLVQDRPSSVIWGMPGAIAQAGLASAVVRLDAMAQAVCDRVLPERAGLRASAVLSMIPAAMPLRPRWKAQC